MSDWLGLLGGIAGPVISGLLANNATNAQVAGLQQGANVANNALALQQQIYGQNRADLAPWRQYGQAGLQRFADTLGPSFQASPGYQWAMDQGVSAIDRSAAARGGLASGGTLKALTRFGQGLANQEYGNYQNRLAALAGLGQTAAGQGVQAGQAYGSSALAGSNLLAQLAAGQGQAQGAGNLAMANLVTGGLNNLADYWRGIGKA